VTNSYFSEGLKPPTSHNQLIILQCFIVTASYYLVQLFHHNISGNVWIKIGICGNAYVDEEIDAYILCMFILIITCNAHSYFNTNTHTYIIIYIYIHVLYIYIHSIYIYSTYIYIYTHTYTLLTCFTYTIFMSVCSPMRASSTPGLPLHGGTLAGELSARSAWRERGGAREIAAGAFYGAVEIYYGL